MEHNVMKSLELSRKLNVDRRHSNFLTISPEWLRFCWTRLEFLSTIETRQQGIVYCYYVSV